MIVVFDLDDTLYPERSYVLSGLAAVAAHLATRHGWDADASSERMRQLLAQHGRGAVFDRLLAESTGRRARRADVRDCLAVYRRHRPRLALHPGAEQVLRRLPAKPYLVTDGHKGVQAIKVDALGLAPRLARAYITHRHGVRHAKPSPHCFELIRRRERCGWRDMVYVGDNPAKDFVALNPLGVTTVRVRTGEHAGVAARPGYEARHVIDELAQLPDVLPQAGWLCGRCFEVDARPSADAKPARPSMPR